MSRILLSPPDVGPAERQMLLDAFDSNWIAPVGPDVDAFEREFAATVGVPYAVSLASGTAALHLALIAAGVRRHDIVITSTLTFAATANVIAYLGAEPVFVDVSPQTWTMDPDLLEEELRARARRGQRVGAVISVDLYGQCADYDRLEAITDAYGVPLVEDAAEALGGSYRGRQAGTFGLCAAFSFNGNKIITTSGGGMLATFDRDVAARVKHLATQAREPAAHYQHHDIGYNYRMSNLLAGIGRAQLASLPVKLLRRRAVNERYRAQLRPTAGLAFMPEAAYGRSNCWLTCIQVDAREFGSTREQLQLHLERHDIETRPVWKPMHLQPVFASCSVRGGAVAARLFTHGLCLPSGSSLTPGDQQRVIGAIREMQQARVPVRAPRRAVLAQAVGA